MRAGIIFVVIRSMFYGSKCIFHNSLPTGYITDLIAQFSVASDAQDKILENYSPQAKSRAA